VDKKIKIDFILTMHGPLRLFQVYYNIYYLQMNTLLGTSNEGVEDQCFKKF
jgi:hypothetical protein